MSASELRDAICSFLDLVECSTSSAPENERNLGFILDQLALATHGEKPTGEVTDSQAPSRNYDEIRAQVASRFPNYGLYRAAGTEPDDEFLVGDAIDDIADIAGDLSEVRWLWENAGETDALWQFHFTFKLHWGSHLRGLQWYIHELKTTG
ncbi:MAG: DUF5063 domain-containing protein [Planctomycetota bacterium]